MPETKPPAWKLALAITPEQIGRCSSVMRELRPHIKAIDFAAHRFYLNRGMDISSHHFQLKLNL